MLARAPFFKVSAIAQNVPFVVKYFHGTMNKIATADRDELVAYEYLEYLSGEKTLLRTVPTIAIAHTFCASPGTRISYRQYLLLQGYFCAV